MASPTSMCLWVGPGFTLIHNDAYIPFLGAKASWAMGRAAKEVWAEVWADLGPDFRRVFETGNAISHEDARHVIRRHGWDEEGFFTFTLSPIQDDDGRVVALLNVSQETTATVRAIRGNDERYRTLFDSIDEGFCIIEVLFDETGRPNDYLFLEVNRAFEKQTGLVDVHGKRVRELIPHQDEHWFQIYGRIATTGDPERFESRGEAMNRDYDVYAFRVGAPEKRRVAVLFKDVSERKRAEAELLAMNQQLREADQRKTEFLAMLSHELRNPLAPIRYSLFLLEQAAPGSAQAARAIEIMRRQSEHLTRLVDDLLDISRISRGKIPLDRKSVDLGAIVRKTTEDLQPVFAHAGLALSVDNDPSRPLWVDADATRMTQVLGNLLNNSARFTPEGGSVHVQVTAGEGSAELTVRDDGIGMEPSDIETMFEPFVQASETLARTKGGLGLGLALVRSIVELHGGTVRARSDGPGTGAEFVVRLPLASEGTPSEPGSPPGADTTPKRILVVEDNMDGAESLAQILEFQGHRVSLARDGRSGIALAMELQPDVLLCDIGLPDVDGYEVARTLRNEERLRGMRFVALTGYAQPEDRERAREAGFDAHLAKPVEVQELIRVLAEEG